MATKSRFAANRKPFSSHADDNKSKSFQKELQAAQTTGILNLSNRDLENIPSIFLGTDVIEGSSKSQTFDGESPRWWEVSDIRKVFVHCNKLSVLPPEFFTKWTNTLTVLDIHENNLAELSILIGDVQQLQSLNVGHNRLSRLPDTIVNLQSLREFNASHNNFSSLPPKWGSLLSLTALNLAHNKLESLPDSICNCIALTTLDLSYNKLSTLPSNFSKLIKVQSLELSFNKLSRAEFSSLEQLSLLKLDHNCLKSFPDVRNCRKLKELSACDNEISEFNVTDMTFLKSLSILNLRGNKLSSFPDEVATALTAIERLDLANNNLSMVPPQLGLVESLKNICLDGNPLRALRRDVVNRGTVFIKQWLVSRLPDSVVSIDPKEETGPSKSPSDFLQGPNDKAKFGDKVDLSNSGPEKIAVFLSQENVTTKELILSKNRLQVLDIAIVSFRSICFLDISSNILRSLPNELSQLGGMRQLNIAANKFSGSLPAVIYSLKSLEVLIASDNALDSFDMGQLLLLTQLSVLDIRNNNFSQLPPTLSTLPSLKHLEVTGNCFKMPRPEIIARGSNAILDYLRTKIT